MVDEVNELEGLITTTCWGADEVGMTIAPPLTARGTTPPDPGRCTRKTGEVDNTLESLEGVTEMATFGTAWLGS